MVSCNCIIINVRKSIPWIGILFTFSLLSAFSGYGLFFSITTTITSLFIFTFSTVFLTFSKQKTVVLLEEPKQEQEQQQEEEDHRQEYPSPAPALTCTTTTEQPKIEAFSPEKKNIRSRDLLYSSESHDQLSSSDCQDSDDIDLVDDDRSPTEFSDDDSISDEESLIEIALPSGIYVGCPKHLEQDHHHQASFMELLAEINDVNEEENLIEIDLSMGSIKCSRFEIQA